MTPTGGVHSRVEQPQSTPNHGAQVAIEYGRHHLLKGVRFLEDGRVVDVGPSLGATDDLEFRKPVPDNGRRAIPFRPDPRGQNSMTSRPRVPPASSRRWASPARSGG